MKGIKNIYTFPFRDDIGPVLEFWLDVYMLAEAYPIRPEIAIERVLLGNSEVREKYKILINAIYPNWKQILKNMLAFWLQIADDKLNDVELSKRIFALQTLLKSKIKPVKIENGWRKGDYWLFNWFIYEVDQNSQYTDEQCALLILEEFDKERRRFEKLRLKFADDPTTSDNPYSRPRIPESVRIEVWRRDGGKCARCGNREKLEYDHIVPISRGGSNTARNIELLCEKCNRSKSNNIV